MQFQLLNVATYVQIQLEKDQQWSKVKIDMAEIAHYICETNSIILHQALAGTETT